MEYSLRPVQEKDCEAVLDIFNHYVENDMAAFSDERVGREFFDSFLEQTKDHPFYVVGTEDGRLVGWGFARPYHPARTFQRTAVLGYFLHREYLGKGIGSKLFDRLVEECKKLGIDNFLVSISSLNTGSIRFHEKRGFVECARFKSVGKKLGKDFDVIWMQWFIGR
ncbi:MAG: GNAT family N-acetyltransferase [Candidatus Zixiibacteriota bacterium]|jgi:phosphinothricin acetyltransferase